MLVVMNHNATEEQIAQVVSAIEKFGYEARPIPGGQRVAIGVLRNTGKVDPGAFESMPGVQQVIPVTQPYKQVSREWQTQDTVITLSTGAKVGGGHFLSIAGPCSVESREQIFESGRAVKAAGALALRGGAFKPRSSPYSFQGLGEEGLRYMAEVRDELGLAIVTEAIDAESLALIEQYADMIQIGARNMQNFSLLKRAGQSKLPVLLKRGMSATIQEWLLAAEYILAEGNANVVLCERGLRHFDTSTRNLLDLAAVPVVKQLSHLPVIVDPSHGTGRRDKVLPLARAAAAVGADGLIIEVHPRPDEAVSDAAQTLPPEAFATVMEQVNRVRAALGMEN